MPFVELSDPVRAWLIGMTAVAILNVLLWSASAPAVWRRDLDHPARARYWRWQWALAGIYVLGCASRSVVLRADVQRYCMVDAWYGSPFVGRSIATVAELAFAMQWALLLARLARETQSGLARRIAYAVVPTIAVAETCSWFAVLTTNYLGNAIEEALWASTVGLLCVGFAGCYRSAQPSLRRFLLLALGAGALYVLYMTTVDVPMYVSRWRADEAAGRVYFSLADGLRDSQRWIPTGAWDDWRDEVGWLSLYFSVAVWISLFLVHRPRVQDPLD